MTSLENAYGIMEDISINVTNLQKIETFTRASAYKELLENSETFNTRLCIERKLRMPFIDPITGIAQNHSSLFMKRRQRLPGFKLGQVYSYPVARWRKARRQYLTNPRPFGKVREIEYDEHLENSSSLGAGDTDSKDSKDNRDEVAREWYYEEMELHDMDNFDEPDPESDGDYEEPYSLKRQRRRGVARPRTYTPRSRGRGSRGPRGGRGRANQSPNNFVETAVEMPTSVRSNSRSRSFLSNQASHSSTLSFSGPTTSTPPVVEELQMPLLLPEQKQLEDPDDKLLPPAHYIRKPQEKGKAVPSPYCDFCLGDSKENKKTSQAEDLVSCSDCGRSGHPTCLQFTKNMIISVKKYRWQCIECKYCIICSKSDNDAELLFCDDCDRGYHMYCLSPPLQNPPEGNWVCSLCTEEFHGGRKS